MPFSAERPLRALVVAHNAVAESNRRRQEALADLPATRVRLLTPGWWFEEGRRIEVTPTLAAAWSGGERSWRLGRTLGTGNGTRYVYLSGLAGLIRGWRPDVIDVHEEPFSFAALQTLAAREALAPRAALVFYSAVNVERRWRLPYRLAERAVLARADGAYVPNGEVPSVLRGKGYAGPLEVVPLGVDVERFSRAGAAELPQTWPRPRVGFLGRLEPVKGLDVLIEAVSQLRRAASVLIAGDGPEKARLQALAAARSVQERVVFPGQVAYADVPAFLKALDVLVLPSVTLLPQHKEQFGRVLVEAMAAGVPVVGSTSGAIPEVIGDAGLVVPEGDASALARAVERVLDDSALRASLVARASQRVASRYAWPVLAGRTRELYLRAVMHRQARRARSVGRQVVEGRA
jgi:glycosyltransferase involved in cell wall biosynthesis